MVFTGGQGPAPGVARRLAEEADRIAAADSGLDAAEAAGVRPGWIIGDMDSVDPGRLHDYPPECVVRHPHEKDFTDTELALSFLWEQGCDDVWIAGGGGGRLDHLFALRALFERERAPRRWITSHEDIWALDAGDALAARDFVPLGHGGGAGAPVFSFVPGTIMAAAPLGEGPWKASSTGLKWPLDGVKWNRGFFGASNETTGEDFSVRVEKGRFMILAPLVFPGGGVWR
jgi:thiamine pyrophosphokinase